MRFLIGMLLAAAGCAEPCLGADATGKNALPDWIYSTEFEEGPDVKWDNDTPPDYANMLVKNPGPLNLPGNTVARLRVPAGRGGRGLIRALPQGYDKIYARWYIQYEPGFDFSAPNHGGGLHAGDRWKLGVAGHRPKGDDYFTATVQYSDRTPDKPTPFVYTYYRGMYQDCADPNGKCWGDSFPFSYASRYPQKSGHAPTGPLPVFEAGRWYCVELMMDAGTPVQEEGKADGQMALWIDGKEIGAWKNLWFRTKPEVKLNLLWLALFHHGDHSEAGVLYDNVAISAQPIGPLTAKSQ